MTHRAHVVIDSDQVNDVHSEASNGLAAALAHRPQPAQEFRPGFGGVAVTPETAII
jgi:hypothetical protein